MFYTRFCHPPVLTANFRRSQKDTENSVKYLIFGKSFAYNLSDIFHGTENISFCFTAI